MSSRKCLCFFLLCAVLGAAAALAGDRFREWAARPCTESWRLEMSVEYDEEVREGIARMQTEKQACVLWKKKKGVVVENPDFRRRMIVDAYGMAGSSSVLFPNTGGLSAGETGYCIVSSDVAAKLFGGTDIIGRVVRIGSGEYTVSGVVFRQDKVCAYELPADGEHKLTHAAVFTQSRAKNHMLKQEVNTFLN